MAWTRVVQLERQEWVPRRSEWVPSDDVRNVQKHTETYWAAVTDPQVGSVDSGIPGPGVSPTRTELRIRFYYTYEALEWHKGRALTASGASQKGVSWPDYTLEPRERVRSQKETYSVTFTSGDKQYETTLPEKEWRALEPGATYHLTLGLLRGVHKIAPAAE